MSGRHAQQGRVGIHWPSWVAGIVVVVGALAGSLYLVLDNMSQAPADGEQDQGEQQDQATCEGSIPLSVAAAPGISTALAEIVEAQEAAALSVDGVCVTAEVASIPAAAFADSLDGGEPPDLWVPDSSLWTRQVSGGGIELGEGRSLATSPLVVVAPQDMARQQLGWPEAEFSWTDILAGGLAMTIADPVSTSEGLATLLAVQSAVGDTEADQTRLVEAMTAISRSAVPDVDEAYQQVVADPAEAPLFTATERSVVAHNEQHPDDMVVALYPAEGTAVFDYPAVPVRAGGTDQRAQAVDVLVEALRSESASAVLQDAGFRGPDGTPRESAGVTDGIQAQMPAVMPSPEPQAATAALRQWAALSLDMRMLAVIDVSGSMWETDDGERTRIELVRDANLAALEVLPPTGHVGLWAFSTQEDPPNHWRQLVGVGPLDGEVGNGPRVEALKQATVALPESDVQGWTALYDTAWAAFQEVKESYDPNRVNSVVLLTDGEDERAPELPPGMDLETLLTQLRAQHDPARPVLLITIGIGPDADMEALRKISEATGASAYQAEDPADVQEIYFRAMLERQCRPNC